MSIQQSLILLAQGNLVKESSKLVDLLIMVIRSGWLIKWSLIIFWVGLAGCVRTASPSGGQPALSRSVGSPTWAAMTSSPIPIPSEIATPTPLRSAAPGLVLTPAVGATASPVASQPTGLPSTVSQVLAIFPLETGSTWVYTEEAYSGDEKATWRVVDTVTDNLVRSSLFAARVQREVTLLSGIPSAHFIHPPTNEVFWYLVDGKAIYRQDVDQPAGLAWDGLDRLTLEWVLPLSAQAPCWFPDPSQRQAMPVPGASGCRTAGAEMSLKSPAGAFNHCHPVMTNDSYGSDKLIFCDGVGIASHTYDRQDHSFGEQLLLTGYLVQSP